MLCVCYNDVQARCWKFMSDDHHMFSHCIMFTLHHAMHGRAPLLEHAATAAPPAAAPLAHPQAHLVLWHTAIETALDVRTHVTHTPPPLPRAVRPRLAALLGAPCLPRLPVVILVGVLVGTSPASTAMAAVCSCVLWPCSWLLTTTRSSLSS